MRKGQFRSMLRVMHIRRKGVKKTLKDFIYVGGERIDVVEKYKDFGCTVNEHLRVRTWLRKEQ